MDLKQAPCLRQRRDVGTCRDGQIKSAECRTAIEDQEAVRAADRSGPARHASAERQSSSTTPSAAGRATHWAAPTRCGPQLGWCDRADSAGDRSDRPTLPAYARSRYPSSSTMKSPTLPPCSMLERLCKRKPLPPPAATAASRRPAKPGDDGYAGGGGVHVSYEADGTAKVSISSLIQVKLAIGRAKDLLWRRLNFWLKEEVTCVP